MKFLLSLDYELFFGSKTGSSQHCLVEPVAALLGQLERTGLKLSLFVDAAFLVRLRQEGRKFPALQAEYDKIRRHLGELKQQGHDVQLHIHPHWLDSHFDGACWRITTKRYTLHDFPLSEREDIVRLCKQELVNIAGDSIFAFRGGGWCIQPFEQIADALQAENVWLESTVFYQGKSEDRQRNYDFSAAPDLDHYRFATDPVSADPNGSFVEVPIGSFRINPLFFWRLAWAKKFGGKQYRSFGDGSAMVADKSYYVTRLTQYTNSVISIDGLKAGLLATAYQQTRQNGSRELFHVMGHPKALTPYSIDRLHEFLQLHSFDYITFQDLACLKPTASEFGSQE